MMGYSARGQLIGTRVYLRQNCCSVSSSPSQLTQRHSRSLSRLSNHRDGFATANSQARRLGVYISASLSRRCQPFRGIERGALGPTPGLLVSSRCVQSWAQVGTLFSSSSSNGKVRYVSTELKPAQAGVEHEKRYVTKIYPHLHGVVGSMSLLVFFSFASQPGGKSIP